MFKLSTIVILYQILLLWVEHFDNLVRLPFLLPPVSSTNGKMKIHSSGFSMFWDIINSWLDIQTDFDKKMFEEEKSPASNSGHTNTKGNKSCVYII